VLGSLWGGRERDVQSCVEGLLVQDLELDEMHVNGVGLRGGVDPFPHFHGAFYRELPHGTQPSPILQKQHGRIVVAVVELPEPDLSMPQNRSRRIVAGVALLLL